MCSLCADSCALCVLIRVLSVILSLAAVAEEGQDEQLEMATQLEADIQHAASQVSSL